MLLVPLHSFSLAAYQQRPVRNEEELPAKAKQATLTGGGDGLANDFVKYKQGRGNE